MFASQLATAALFGATCALAAPLNSQDERSTVSDLVGLSPVTPTQLAITIDPNFQRDSCITATKLIDGRVFWICRDTLNLQNETLNEYIGFIESSSASWSNQTAAGNAPVLTPVPASQGQKPVTSGFSQQLTQYGGPFPLTTPYLYYAPDQYPPGGAGPDFSRYEEWPDAPLYITDVASDGTTTGYLFPTAAANGGNITDEFPGTTLYKITYTPTSNLSTLPTVEMIAEHFFPRYGFNYGAFGGVISPTDNMLYLWGETYAFYGLFVQNPVYNVSLGLARVALDSIENIDAYEYYYPATNTWNETQPNIYNKAANVTVGYITGQGTFFYNEKESVYVFVGQNQNETNMEVTYSVAQQPEGPWSLAAPPVTLSNDFSYSLAAHPEMGDDPNNLYVSFTANFDDSTGKNQYKQPLYQLQFDWTNLDGVLQSLPKLT
ncbi:hypothetical protein BD324DRAFT_651298 [Kockovaella imperatae]|uniref:DUF4185 domain-containing protein n=1 Tax=Kockovaella imperatae TaxID=4999 RepID=A0A1Y1UH17_9TREE|nr:hypothetical protein BD324DRAFT_651298 [Kockovaella imperatae]ORX36817.1 hypothetical protein BD324DRAFT_651298 [Kockovaella imperatae]